MRFRAKGGGLAIAFATVASAVTLLVPARSSAVTCGRVRRPGRRDPAERRLVQVLEGEQGPGIQEEEEAGLRQEEEAEVRRNHDGDRA